LKKVSEEYKDARKKISNASEPEKKKLNIKLKHLKDDTMTLKNLKWFDKKLEISCSDSKNSDNRGSSPLGRPS
jgi:hypothetical protein